MEYQEYGYFVFFLAVYFIEGNVSISKTEVIISNYQVTNKECIIFKATLIIGAAVVVSHEPLEVGRKIKLVEKVLDWINEYLTKG